MPMASAAASKEDDVDDDEKILDLLEGEGASTTSSLSNLKFGNYLTKEKNACSLQVPITSSVATYNGGKNQPKESQQKYDNNSSNLSQQLESQNKNKCFQDELYVSNNLVCQSNQWFKEINLSTREYSKCRILNENDGTFLTVLDEDLRRNEKETDILEIYFEDFILEDNVKGENQNLLSSYKHKNLTEQQIDLCFNDLPDEIILRIFSYFTKRELCSYVAPICLSWFYMAKDPLFWTSIYETEFYAIESELLTKIILSWCKQLSHLELDNRSDITNEGFDIIFKSCPKIKHLSLKLCRQVNDQVLKLISRYEKNLQSIDLEGCVNLSDSSFAHFIELPIESVAVSHCTHITDEGAIFIVRNFRNLKELNLDGVQWITDDFVKELVAHQSETIEKVFLDGENITDDSIRLISKCSNLRSLGQSFCNNLTSESISNIQKCCNLRELKLRKGPHFTSESLIRFFENMSGEQGKNFRSLNLAECQEISDECLWQISKKCFNLVYLDLSWCWEVLDGGIAFIIDNCHKLKQLHLIGLHKLSGVPFSRIPSQNHDLIYLDLSDCNNIEDEILVHLVGVMPKLTIKNYYGEKMTMEPDLYYSDDSDF